MASRDIPVYYFEWDDHYEEKGWKDIKTTKKEDNGPEKVETVGFLFHEDDKGYYVCSSIGINKERLGIDTAARMYIMKSAVTKKKRVTI